MDNNNATELPATTAGPVFPDLDGDMPTVNGKVPIEAASIMPEPAHCPCFVVWDDWQEEHGKRYKPGVWFFDLKRSKGDNPPAITKQYVCSPLHIDAQTTDGRDGSYGLLLRFKSGRGHWKRWAMPSAMLAGDGAELRGYLLSSGVRIAHNGDPLLLRFLKETEPRKRVQCVTQTGWAGHPNDKGRAFVLPDVVIGPGAAGIVYQTDHHAGEEYNTAGTLDGWRRDVAALAVGNPLLTLAICLAFAGPVMGRVNHTDGGGLHFFGDSSKGKSSFTQAAMSVWGGAAYKRTWRATTNGMEGMAELFNDSLLVLDDIGQQENPRAIGNIIYSLGDGIGKQRAGRSGAARTVRRWRCSILSNGEKSTETAMGEAGARITAGQTVRLVDVPTQRTYGAWDTLHGHGDGATFSNHLKDATQRHHGHAGREFLKHLTKDEADLAAALEAIKAHPLLKPGTTEGQAVRVAARFALLALAGELATQYGVTGWPEGEAVKAAGAGLLSWRIMKGDRPQGVTVEREQLLDKLRGFIERYGESRFTNVDGLQEHERPPSDRAGWWRQTADGRRYWFTKSGLQSALVGFDWGRSLTALRDAGAMEAGSNGKHQKQVKIDGDPVRVYVINPARLHLDDTTDGGEA